MLDPVIASDGQTYDRAAIQSWFETCRAEGRTVRSPLSGIVLDNLTLMPNIALRKAIDDLVLDQPDLRTLSAGRGQDSPDAKDDELVKENDEQEDKEKEKEKEMSEKQHVKASAAYENAPGPPAKKEPFGKNATEAAN